MFDVIDTADRSLPLSLSVASVRFKSLVFQEIKFHSMICETPLAPGESAEVRDELRAFSRSRLTAFLDVCHIMFPEFGEMISERLAST